MTTLRQSGESMCTGEPRGVNLLNRPTLNRGTAFTEDERIRFGLQGCSRRRSRAWTRWTPEYQRTVPGE